MIIANVIGNIGRDAELRDANGQKVCNFTVASNEKKGDQDVTTWVKCALWGNRAEKLCQYLKKGTKVFVSGTCGLENFTRQDGSPGTTLTLNVQHFEFAGSPQQNNQQGNPAPQQQAAQPAYGQPAAAQPNTSTAFAPSDDIPF